MHTRHNYIIKTIDDLRIWGTLDLVVEICLHLKNKNLRDPRPQAFGFWTKSRAVYFVAQSHMMLQVTSTSVSLLALYYICRTESCIENVMQDCSHSVQPRVQRWRQKDSSSRVSKICPPLPSKPTAISHGEVHLQWHFKGVQKRNVGISQQLMEFRKCGVTYQVV